MLGPLRGFDEVEKVERKLIVFSANVSNLQ